MQRFLKVLRWIAKHMFVKVVNLNDQGECPGDEDVPPKKAIVVGVGGKF